MKINYLKLNKRIFYWWIFTYAYKHFSELHYQAIAITIVTSFGMLLLYQTRIIVVLKK